MTQPSTSSLTQRFRAAQERFAKGDVAGAQAEFAALADLAPKSPEIAVMQGRVAARLRLNSDAIAHFKRALTAQPDAVAILAELATVSPTHDAVALYDRLSRQEPKNPRWVAEKAILHQQVGDFDQAGKTLRRALKKAPNEAELFRILVQGEKLKPADPLIRIMQKQLLNDKLPDRARIQVAYALAKVMADIGRHDQVFACLRRANTLERKQSPFNFADMERDAQNLLAAQEGLTFPPQQDTADLCPIFIVGTPRSGTTLIERILSAHPKVVAAGETGFAMRGVSVLLGKPDNYGPLKVVPQDQLDAYARAFDRHIRRLADVVQYVTDKSMMNHLILGLIRYTMPAARILVVNRDPRDIAVSIYRNHFVEGRHLYSNDLGDIARFIAQFHCAIAHWQTRLPEPLHVVHYEKLVADPETESRALIAAAGLDWDDACLSPHTSSGAVKTLSLHQVRQPIYQTSARGWTRYADDLKPFDDVWESLNGAD